MRTLQKANDNRFIDSSAYDAVMRFVDFWEAFKKIEHRFTDEERALVHCFLSQVSPIFKDRLPTAPPEFNLQQWIEGKK